MQDEIIICSSRDKLPTAWTAGRLARRMTLERIGEHLDIAVYALSRSEIETDPRFKQLIPYLILEHQGKIAAYPRHGSEDRLHGLWSLGIGGHVKDDDGENWMELMLTGARRELQEELPGAQVELNCLGIVNEEESEVGAVHLGIVFEAKLKNDDFTISDELKGLQWLSCEEVGTRLEHGEFELWSTLAWELYQKRNEEPKEALSFTTSPGEQLTLELATEDFSGRYTLYTDDSADITASCYRLFLQFMEPECTFEIDLNDWTLTILDQGTEAKDQEDSNRLFACIKREMSQGHKRFLLDVLYDLKESRLSPDLLDDVQMPLSVAELEECEYCVSIDDVFSPLRTYICSVDGAEYCFVDHYLVEPSSDSVLFFTIHDEITGEIVASAELTLDRMKWEHPRVENQRIPIQRILEAFSAIPGIRDVLLNRQRAMRRVFSNTYQVQAKAPTVPGRNAPCPCGSGKKYKKCCMKKTS